MVDVGDIRRLNLLKMALEASCRILSVRSLASGKRPWLHEPHEDTCHKESPACTKRPSEYRRHNQRLFEGALVPNATIDQIAHSAGNQEEHQQDQCEERHDTPPLSQKIELPHLLKFLKFY